VFFMLVCHLEIDATYVSYERGGDGIRSPHFAYDVCLPQNGHYEVYGQDCVCGDCDGRADCAVAIAHSYEFCPCCPRGKREVECEDDEDQDACGVSIGLIVQSCCNAEDDEIQEIRGDDDEIFLHPWLGCAMAYGK